MASEFLVGDQHHGMFVVQSYDGDDPHRKFALQVLSQLANELVAIAAALGDRRQQRLGIVAGQTFAAVR
ncbi:hypothetical protein GCM10023156_44060 [Novipirellula rosea]|uniref:GAF domain-containing protein n=1 Tax=Novipirellula rosea TaxID=1031540 RepID=A0ABP8N802_9BACT